MNLLKNIKVVGSIDGKYGKDVVGWFYLREIPADYLEIHAESPDGSVTTATCNLLRPDVAEKLGFDAKCGFRLQVRRDIKIEDLRFSLHYGVESVDVTKYYSKLKGRVEDEIEKLSPTDSHAVGVLIAELCELKRNLNNLRPLIAGRPGQNVKPEPKSSINADLESIAAGADLGDFLMSEGLAHLRQLSGTSKKIIINFGIIPWRLRTQRPQHLLRLLAESCNAVALYINPSVSRGAFPRITYERVDASIVEASLDVGPSVFEFYSGESDFTGRVLVERMIKTIMRELSAFDLQFAKVDHPSWCNYIDKTVDKLIIYDKMDEYKEFSNATERISKFEAELLDSADILIASSETLVSPRHKRKSFVIKNAAESDKFTAVFERRRQPSNTNPITIGYVGAISEWFDFDLIIYALSELPKYQFIFLGHCDVAIPEAIRNNKRVQFTGEIPYDRLDEYLSLFDVGIIPFKITPLIRHVDPVKLYEYAACGVPTVVTDMPAVSNIEGVVYKTSSKAGFVSSLVEAARTSRNLDYMARRREFASANSWLSRSNQLKELIDKKSVTQSVSVILLHYGSHSLTEAALYSLLKNTKNRIEIIIVDNAGDLERSSYVTRQISGTHHIVKLIKAPSNLGFSGGMNLGVKHSSGYFVVLANNDIYVSKDWDTSLVRHFSIDPDLCLLGTVTNMAGNEQKMNVSYKSMEEMELLARLIRLRSARKRFPTDNLAFIFVGMRKKFFEQVGGMDESYGRGYFEDDDFCKRVKKIGGDIAIADDVFIHHQHSGSFSLLKSEEKQRIFEANLRKFEKKWGKWKPHVYRQHPLFG
jgi:GT2 family glycosyltransferase/glycosyltransferase involved in cell wall biosynthesis